MLCRLPSPSVDALAIITDYRIAKMFSKGGIPKALARSFQNIRRVMPRKCFSKDGIPKASLRFLSSHNLRKDETGITSL